jgi:amidase
MISRRHALAMVGASAVAPLAAWQHAAPKPISTAKGDLHFISMMDLAVYLMERQISPITLTRYMLDRIAALDPQLSSYATVMADQAMADAAAAEREISGGKWRGALHGVPIAVKDLCYTRGVRTLAGTSVLKGFVPKEDAFVVERLKANGAIILGKLNLTEGAMGGYHPDMGIPRNPWDPGRWPGVSSSGSGVAAAAGLCFAAIGTDTGGSIRFPSAACGLVGLKPTYGRVSRHGVWGLSGSLDHVGPMARYVRDAAVMFDAIAGHDPRDATSLSEPRSAANIGAGDSIKGLRIGIDREYALNGIDAGQAASIETALKVLTGLGARVVDVKMPDLTGMLDAWIRICTPEALSFHKAYYPSRAKEYGPYFRQVLAIGSTVTPEQAAEAQAWRKDFTSEFNALLESVDAMACPAGGAPAWPVTRDLQVGPFEAFSAAWEKASPRAAEFTMPMNLAGTPAICLPSGFSPDGLPYSIQFAGRRLSEALLCRIAYAYERAADWHTRHPSLEA